VAYRIFALPAHVLAHPPPVLNAVDDWLEPELPELEDSLVRALAGAEYRAIRARDRLRALLQSDVPPELPPPAEGYGPSAYFARAPRDLPALLRLADQLEQLAQRSTGERAMVWRCAHCGTRYAVPLHLVREVSIRCESCSQTVLMQMDRALGEEALTEPASGAINALRYRLSGFFREAMARGWPVLVSMSEPGHRDA